ncbi:MAG TPA: alanine dehydrogenase [Thermomicrobiales bacterium]|jgi:alanine dehydrogenase|nr:alanine dehydrogenase [Thermomicrobiales bacterium]
MIVGVAREIKDREARVAATPGGVGEYVRHGHEVLVERGAGFGGGFDDAEYVAYGASIVDDHAEIFGRSDMIIKVKEPIASEYDLLRPSQILFTYLHLAADEPLTDALVERGVRAVAYETVQVGVGGQITLPLLTPMSEVAGRMAVQIGAHYLERPNGGRGTLLGGVPGVAPGRVVIVGGGVVGTNAAAIALGMGAEVTILDRNVERLRQLEHMLTGRLRLLASNSAVIAGAVREADLLIGAVLVAGSRAPRLVTEAMVRQMPAGSVIVDVAIDQGGCIETAHPTSHSDPTYEVGGVLHYCVTNIPGAVPRTSTLALSNVTLPYGLAIADQGIEQAARNDPAIAAGVNVYDGQITHPAVASAFGRPFVPLATVLGA